MYERTLKQRVQETLTKENVKQYLQDTYAKLKDYYAFSKFVYKKKDALWNEWERDTKSEQKIATVVDFITRANESNMRNHNKTLKEEDETTAFTNMYAGTLDEAVKNKYCGDELKKIEEKTGKRLKMGELYE